MQWKLAVKKSVVVFCYNVAEMTSKDLVPQISEYKHLPRQSVDFTLKLY